MYKPATPLFASKMCAIQVLHRDLRLDPELAFDFGPNVLGQDRVYCNRWAGKEWRSGMERRASAREVRERAELGCAGAAVGR